MFSKRLFIPWNDRLSILLNVASFHRLVCIAVVVGHRLGNAVKQEVILNYNNVRKLNFLDKCILNARPQQQTRENKKK